MAPQILGFDVAWGHFDVAWPKLWHKNGVFDQNLGCSGHFDVASEKWAPVALKIFYRYALAFLCCPESASKKWAPFALKIFYRYVPRIIPVERPGSGDLGSPDFMV